MTSVAKVSAYLDRLISRGMGGHDLKLGTRGLDSLRAAGAPLDLEIPRIGDEISRDGKKEVFLRASDGN
jgi:hypothetical protein